MDRLGFLKRLGLLAVTPIIAVMPSITQDRTETVFDGDVRITGKLIIQAPNEILPSFIVNPYHKKIIVAPNITPVDTPLNLILGS